MFPVAANWISHSSHFCCLRKNQPKPINSKRAERLFPMSYLIRILISKASWIRCSPSSLGTGQTVTINKNTLTRSQRCLWSNNYEFNVLIFAELSEGTVIADGDGCEQRRDKPPHYRHSRSYCHLQLSAQCCHAHSLGADVSSRDSRNQQGVALCCLCSVRHARPGSVPRTFSTAVFVPQC